MAYHFHYDKNIHPMYDLVWFTDTIILDPNQTINGEIIDVQGCNYISCIYYRLLAHQSTETLIRVEWIWNVESKYIEDWGIISAGQNEGGRFDKLELKLDAFRLVYVEKSGQGASFEIFIKAWR